MKVKEWKVWKLAVCYESIKFNNVYQVQDVTDHRHITTCCIEKLFISVVCSPHPGISSTGHGIMCLMADMPSYIVSLLGNKLHKNRKAANRIVSIYLSVCQTEPCNDSPSLLSPPFLLGAQGGGHITFLGLEMCNTIVAASERITSLMQLKLRSF